ncbi:MULTISPECIES: hypothetical protein [unclassified Achromobacter]|uniref:hypothetical protein n=1 Tax=unclassified Achromobacter TaxID=2626865 RepID=UPI000B5167D0|nr:MULTISPECIES: hypothetical protein [unclassified Achromobacter]OWT74611.1 hypothetical protein CEY05_18625 [Achromobacter sp. HZ34]OWT79078.1 hypothetical protein CEY04_08545 [Achromobacter sp. HZ28]
MTIALSSGEIRTQICMETFTGQHPAIKDAFSGERLDTLIAQARTALSGKSAWPSIDGLMFDSAPTPYTGNAIPEASATVYPSTLQSPQGGTGESGQTLVSCNGFSAGSITGNSSISPDYGVAYIAARHAATVQDGPPFPPRWVPWVALFTIRVWHAATAVLGFAGGNNQSAGPKRNFQPLSLTTTDSTGSQRATDGMQVTFDITQGDVTFDPSGVTTRYCFITDNGRRAVVISQQGLAISPPIKASPAVGPVTVLATSRFAANSLAYSLTVA